MRVLFTWGCVFLLAFPIALTTAQTSETDQKQMEAQAKQLAAEGAALEKQGKLAEARDKYVDAEGVEPNGDALSGIARVDSQQKQQGESAVAEAHRLYDAGKFSESIEQLEHALELQPGNAAAHYDLALGYLKLDDRVNAALHLDLAIGTVWDEKERLELLEKRSTVLMGMAGPEVSTEGSKNLVTFNESYLAEDRDPRDTKAQGGSLCDQTTALRTSLSANPAVIFNSAKCAEQDGRPGDAARELSDYAHLVPKALDLTEAELQERTLLSLASLPGEQGQTVRQNYATASRYLDYRRYDRVIAEYETAAQAAPDYPETQWRLGLLYESYGDVTKAREHFARFQELQSGPAQRSDADIHLANLNERRAVYDANITEAQDIISTLLLRSLGVNSEGGKHKTKLTYRQRRWASRRYKDETRATEKLPEPFVQRELGRAREDLEAATELFPLGAEANELLALINLQGNDWPGAYGNYDAVASQGFPVSFYAQVNSARDSNVVRAAKVEIGTDTIRLVYLSSYDPRKQISSPPSIPAGEDDLGNLLISAAHPLPAQAETFAIRASDLKGIETDKNFVVLKLASDQIYLAPLNMLSSTPFEGGASRTFGNEYTRLFVRYVGYEDAKLGKEGMTAGEKFKMGFEIARIGTSVGFAVATMGAGAPAAYGAALRATQLAHALSVFHSVAQGVRAINVADASIRLADDVQMNVVTLERATNDQRSLLAGMMFKVIPEQTADLKFREKF